MTPGTTQGSTPGETHGRGEAAQATEAAVTATATARHTGPPPLRSRRAAVLAAMLAGIFLIGRTSGAGWIVVIGAGVAAVVLVGAVWPLACVRLAAIDIAAPADATATVATVVTVSRTRGRAAVVIRIREPRSEWLRLGTGAGAAAAVPARRGVVQRVEVDVRCAAPLGLVAWRRRVVVALPTALHVGPRPAPAPVPAVLRLGAGAEVVRGAREYSAGDPPKLVHWPLSARRGDLMVKEMEEARPPLLAMTVDLRGAEAPAEAAAARAAGLAAAALATGMGVVLATAEPAGPTVALVASRREAGRRLARAVAGPPGCASSDGARFAVHVSAAGDRWG